MFDLRHSIHFVWNISRVILHIQYDNSVDSMENYSGSANNAGSGPPYSRFLNDLPGDWCYVDYGFFTTDNKSEPTDIAPVRNLYAPVIIHIT